MIKSLATTLFSLSLVTAASGQTIEVTRSGSRAPRPAPAENFTGTVRFNPLFQTSDPANGVTLTFEAGARTAWHRHPLDQFLIVTAGTGRVQMWGGPVDEIAPGDVVRIPPNTKHWHGASPASSMTHIAITEKLEGKTAEWLEPVTDEQYNMPVRSKSSEAGAGPSREPRIR
jgi:4-carboxymuconolactone decarboxylase